MAWTFMTLRQRQGDWNPGLIASPFFLSLLSLSHSVSVPLSHPVNKHPPV